MRQDWFILSLEDGGLRPTRAPGSHKPVRWIERDLENLLALNPDFLGLADQQPVRLRGVRGTVTSPDQAYFDELGRSTVVEVKRIRASLPVLAQAISYGNHWSLFPPGEIGDDLEELADRKRRGLKFGNALYELISWASGKPDREGELALLEKLGDIALERINPPWANNAAADIRSWALNRCKGGHFPCLGAAPRYIVVATGFTDESVEFAEQLSQRMVPIELTEVEVIKERGNIYVGRTFVHRDPHSEPTWRLLRRAWELPIVRNHFAVNGWADALNRESFSLSAADTFDAKFWLCASDDEANITTVVPDGWYRGRSELRKSLRTKFLDALPNDVDRGERWLEWEFKLPKEREDAVRCVSDVASAILEVLVPAAHEAREFQV